MKTIIFFIVFVFFLANLAQSQVKFRVKKLNADSLVTLISEKDGKEKIEVLNLLSNVICRINIDSSINLATQAINLSEKIEYQKGLADGYFNTGNVFFLLDSLQPTISNYLKALRIYEDFEPSEEYGNLCMQLGIVNYFTGRFDESADYGRQALLVYKKLDDKAGQSMVYLGKGSFKHLVDKEWDSAFYFLNKALLCLDTMIHQNEMAIVYSEIGLVYQSQFYESNDSSYLSMAIPWFFKALDLAAIYDEYKAWMYLYIGTAYLDYNTEKYTPIGIEYLQKANRIADTCYDAYDYKSIIYELLGKTSYLQGDYNKSINIYKQGINIIEERLSGFSINEFREPFLAYNNKYYHKLSKQLMYKGLFDIYTDMGNYKQAHEYYKLSKEAEEEIYLENNQNLITMLEAISEDEKIEKQLILLERNNKLKEVEIKQSRILVYSVIGAFTILLLIGFLIVRQNRLKNRHKTLIREQKLLHNLELKEIESKKLRELDHLKSKFFANVSHEFRTPLTLIMGPLNKMLSKTEDSNDKRELSLAKKYAGNLQSLINNLLSISKIESGKMQLTVTEIDIVRLVRGYLLAFESLAKQKNIALKFTSEHKEVKAFIDREKFEQILNNLLSNAIKFIGGGGKIEVEISTMLFSKKENQPTVIPDQSGVEIKISDTGCGISPEHISHVFDRFYQVEGDDNNYHEGTGIGLALSKELVELHHGKIEVESKVDAGTTFTIILPLGKDHLDPKNISMEKPESTISSQFVPDIIQSEKVPVLDNNVEDDDTTPIMLIVEDNTDMRSYIKEYFENEFNIIEAIDGAIGFKKAVEHIPDVIISDVMMPNMNGNEFCNKVKLDERTSHIPIILLTALASKESRIDGLETGADDYIIKPFDGEELKVRVKNLIEQRKRLSLKLESEIRKNLSYVKIDFKESDITSMDEQFLQKVIKTVNEQYSDPEFNAKLFSMTIGLSRVQLHRKMKALTGQSTGEFIRTFRLTHAAELIKKESGTVAEIAYDVGFSSPSYFSECFKLQFGKLPSEYNGGTK